MGRQSSGKSFIKGIARTWPNSQISGIGHTKNDGVEMLRKLQADGFSGTINWSNFPSIESVRKSGALYFPSPSPKDLAHLRNTVSPSAFSLMGVTYTLSSATATDGVADLILPPFKPWDALICISECAKEFTLNLHQEMKDWWTSQVGSIQFNSPQLPVIMLGIDAPFFETKDDEKRSAKQALEIKADETVFLFSGRLSFHAKANPAPMYQALEKAAKETEIVCIEAGVFPNDAIRDSYLEAQKILAPSVRFIWVDGKLENKYRQAWQAADVFISLSDNIQETFGLTPVEAMAAGLPVIVADWNGYKETVRDGIDGFRIPTILPPNGSGGDLAMRHALEIDTYDFYIGRVSLATVVDPNALAEAVLRIATDSDLRGKMKAAGLKRAREDFDWPVILKQYSELASELEKIRVQSQSHEPIAWPQRADPFQRFSHFPSSTLRGDWRIKIKPNAASQLKELLNIRMVNYAFDKEALPPSIIETLVEILMKGNADTVVEVLNKTGKSTPVGVRALMWLWKFDLIQVENS